MKKIFLVLFLFVATLQTSYIYNTQSKPKPTGSKVTDKWKKQISEDFYKNISTIKQIILEGESEEEKEDFLNRFKEQRNWFDKTVSGTQYFFDPNYNAIMQKKLTIQKIIDIQEKADTILKKEVEKEKIPRAIYKKLRLVILYDLNNMLQKQLEAGKEEDETEENKKINNIVIKAINSFKTQKWEVEKIVKDEIEILEKELKTLRSKLQKEQNLKKIIEKKNKANLELEIILQKTKANIEKLKKEAATRSKMQTEKKLKPILEQKNKENVNLQIRLSKLQKELELTKKEVLLWQNKTKESENKRLIETQVEQIKANSAQKQALQEHILRKEAENTAAINIKLTKQEMANKEKELEKKEAKLEKQIASKQKELEIKKTKLANLESKLEEQMINKQKELEKKEAKLEKQIASKQKELEKKEAKLTNLKSKLEEQMANLNKNTKILEQEHQDILNQEAEISKQKLKLEEEISALEEERRLLLDQETELENKLALKF